MDAIEECGMALSIRPARDFKKNHTLFARQGATPRGTAAKIATPHNPAIIYKPGDGVVSSGLAYVAVRACQAVVC